MTRPPAAPPASTSGASGAPADEEDLLLRLPTHDVAPALAETIRGRAHQLLRQRREPRRSSPGWEGSYHRLVEPALLIGLGLWQLAWTVQDTVALFLP